MKLGQGFVELGLKQGALKSGLAQAKQMLSGWMGALGGGYMFKAAIGAAVEEQASNARLAGVIRATGAAAGFTADAMRDMADSMAEATRFTDEEVKSASAVLLTFKAIRGEQLERTVAVAADLAEVLGSDMRSAAVQLGKALEDPKRGLTALRRSGVSFTAAEKEMINGLVKSGNLIKAQGIILDALEGQVGGVARAMNVGAAGGVARFKKAITELTQDLGTGLTPAIELAGGAVQGFLAGGRGAAAWVADLVSGISSAERALLEFDREAAASARKLAAEQKQAAEESKQARIRAAREVAEAEREAAEKIRDAMVTAYQGGAKQLEALQGEVKMLQAGFAGDPFAVERARAGVRYDQELARAKRVEYSGAESVAESMRAASYRKLLLTRSDIAKREKASVLEGVEDLVQGIYEETLGDRARGGGGETGHRVASLREIGDVGHRVASLREIGLAAQGKLPGQQGEKREALTAAQQTAKNTTRLVQLFKDGAVVGSATYQ